MESDGEENNLTIKKQSKLWLILLGLGSAAIIAAAVLIILTITRPEEELEALVFPELPTPKTESGEKYYSVLTGKEISDPSLNSSPVFCMQTPNGLDGARPQAGINEAAIVFEAIAEAGITRFAAIYQNPESSVIGPVRSLRMYYLDWDTPFDCTITHAGGAYDALVAVQEGGYKDLSEDYAYMYRGTIGSRLWNNLFTTSTYLKQFATDYGYNTSNPKGFTRTTPEQAERTRINDLANNKLSILGATSASTTSLAPKIRDITVDYGGWANFNPVYHYNESTNSYDRSYENGDAHNVYNCPEGDRGENNPESICELKQLSPSVVITMTIYETLASDNYHEAITTVGSGTAHIFQNGTVINGTWSKESKWEQIKFFDEAGNEISLIPGQTWISAVPHYGSVNY